MTNTSSPTFTQASAEASVCAVLVARIDGYEARSLFDQISVTAAFQRHWHLALPEMNDAHAEEQENGGLFCTRVRLVECIELAKRLLALSTDEPQLGQGSIRIGLNLGPVEFAVDSLGTKRCMGVGVFDAEAASLALEPGCIAVTGAFRSVVVRSAPEVSDEFRRRAAVAEEGGTSLELYQIGDGNRQNPDWIDENETERAQVLPPPVTDASALAPHNSEARRARWWHSPFVRYVLAPTLIVACVVLDYQPWKRQEGPAAVATKAVVAPSSPQRVEVAIAKPAAEPSAVATPAAESAVATPLKERTVEAMAPNPTVADQTALETVTEEVVVPAEAPAVTTNAMKELGPIEQFVADAGFPLAQVSGASPSTAASQANGAREKRVANLDTAKLQFHVKPWGEIFLNGKRVGVSPPLKSLPVPPGTHVVRVENGNLPSFEQSFSVEARDKFVVIHDFH